MLKKICGRNQSANYRYKVLMQLSQKELIDNSGMPILSAVEFQEAADQVKHFLKY
jgi:hypothetical protein